jgi:hypothetical protein
MTVRARTKANAEFDNLAGQARVWYPMVLLPKPLGGVTGRFRNHVHGVNISLDQDLASGLTLQLTTYAIGAFCGFACWGWGRATRSAVAIPI